MKTLLAKRRDPAYRFVLETLERRTLLSATPGGAVVGPGPSQASDLLHLAATPNDPQYTAGNLWGLNGPSGIQAPSAWNVTTGSPSVTIADIDTGINYNHPDLYQNIWINQPEIPISRMKNLVDVYHDGYMSWRDLNNPINIGPGKITDVNGDGVIDAADILAPMSLDANGNDTGLGGWANPSNVQDGDTAHPDDLIGWNFVDNNNNPFDTQGHGTETAGTIAATGNNATGVVGVAWSSPIMALKVIDASGNATVANASAAILYAARHGAKVANASFGGYGASAALQNAIATAGTEGMVVVAAAGNDGLDTDTSPFFPADFDLANEISVGAIDATGQLASFSNYGAKTVDLAAPGTGIITTLVDGTYGPVSGTSVAAPFVTGTIALVASVHPTWTAAELVRQVLATATPDPALSGLTITGGVVNAAAAVGPAAIATTPLITWPTPADIVYGTALGPGQLDATASAFGIPVSGTFTYSSPAGTVLHTGAGQTLSVTFTPDNLTDYHSTTSSVLINVTRATPTIAWPTPADITYGTPLGPNQLDASASFSGGSIAGTFAYTPVAGTILPAGYGQVLLTVFTPTDTVDFTTAVASTKINVQKATPSVYWTSPAGITYGTPLGPNQLNATSGIPGVFTYTVASGTILGAGPQPLTATFTPSDTNNYNDAAVGTLLNVAKAHLVVLAGNNVTRYGSPPPSLTYALAGFINGDTSSVVNGSPSIGTTATPASGVGTYPITVGPGTLSAANYDFPNFVPGTLTVNRAFLTVSANSTSRVIGCVNPALTYSVTGFVNGDSPSVLTGAPTLNTTAVVSSPRGGYPITITPGTLSAANYAFAGFAGATLTVRPLSASRVGDFDGDGKTDLAIFRQSSDLWIIRNSAGGGQTVQFGDPTQGDVPVAADYEGIGRSDLALFRPTTDQWIIRLSTGATQILQFGDPSQHDIPVPGDYEGIGRSDLAVFRPSTDQWIIRLSTGATQVYQCGDPSQHDIPVPGDYDGDGKTDLAVFRPATDLWIVRYSSGGGETVQFGDPTQRDVPAPGDYDGDGKTDFAVFRPTTDVWIVRYSSGGGETVPFGDPTQGDLAALAPISSLPRPISPKTRVAAVSSQAAVPLASFAAKTLARVMQPIVQKART